MNKTLDERIRPSDMCYWCGEKNIKDWQGIKNFYEKESYKGYPFSECKFDNWGFGYL